MKKFFEIFFIILGVIFFVLIISGIYLYVADPFEIKPVIKSLTNSGEGKQESTDSAAIDSIKKTQENVVVDKNPMLTPTQEAALEKVGIDPANVPTTITPEMEECFLEKLGEKRVIEIKGGSEPTMTDLFQARSCL